MKKLPKPAAVFVALVATAAVLVVAEMMWRSQLPSWGPNWGKLAAFLVFAAVGSVMSLKLPGMTSTMSVNLPFILLAAAEFSGPEVCGIALLCAVVQTVRNAHPTRPVQFVFNIAVMVLSSALAQFLCHVGPRTTSAPAVALNLALATVGYFLLNTALVATVVALAENQSIAKAWERMFLMTFPYYVLSMGLGVSASVVGVIANWWTALALIPILFGIYKCYAVYFRATEQHQHAFAAGAH
jgi:hypothetical protein